MPQRTPAARKPGTAQRSSARHAALGRRPLSAPQHFLYFLPLPHGHGSLRPTFARAARRRRRRRARRGRRRAAGARDRRGGRRAAPADAARAPAAARRRAPRRRRPAPRAARRGRGCGSRMHDLEDASRAPARRCARSSPRRAEALALVLDLRIALRVAAQADALAQAVHRCAGGPSTAGRAMLRAGCRARARRSADSRRAAYCSAQLVPVLLLLLERRRRRRSSTAWPSASRSAIGAAARRTGGCVGSKRDAELRLERRARASRAARSRARPSRASARRAAPTSDALGHLEHLVVHVLAREHARGAGRRRPGAACSSRRRTRAGACGCRSCAPRPSSARSRSRA